MLTVENYCTPFFHEEIIGVCSCVVIKNTFKLMKNCVFFFFVCFIRITDKYFVETRFKLYLSITDITKRTLSHSEKWNWVLSFSEMSKLLAPFNKEQNQLYFITFILNIPCFNLSLADFSFQVGNFWLCFTFGKHYY